MRVLCGYRITESGRRVIVRCTAVSWGRSDDDYRVAETKAGLLCAACAKDTGVAALTAVAVVLNSV